MRLWRWLRRAVYGLLAVVVLAAGGAYLVLRASLPELDGEMTLAGLEAPVMVTRDALGVPTISAATRADLARALGFVHGQERFFQMDLLRRDAAGELSAVFGSAALAHDRQRRFHGLRNVARAVVASASDQGKAWLEAYAAGANAGLQALSARPFEYLLVRHEPQPWRTEDTVLAIHAMWLTLTDEDGDRDLALTRMHAVLPEPMYAFLTQAGSDLDAALDGSAWVTLDPPGADVYDVRGGSTAGALDPPRAVPDDSYLDGVQGSNNWAATGRRSSHGGAIVANDMHLSLRVPNIWFRARLVIPGELDLAGLTLPGAPALVAGSNGHIAWGFTNSYVDTTDLVELELDPADPRAYLTGDGKRELTTRTEQIDVAGAEPVQMQIDESVFGPVRRADGKLYAVQWMAHAPEATNLALMRFESVRSVAEALDLAPDVGMPPQNLAVVDAQGNAGWTLVGAVPAGNAAVDRRRALLARDAPAPGKRAAANTPRIMNPADGYVFTANSRVVDDAAYPGLADGSYALGARQAQIRDRLRARETVDERDMLAIQLDAEALFMRRWYELLQQVLDGADPSSAPRRAELRALLPTWSGHARPDDAAYRWTREFRASLHALVLEGLLAEVIAAYPDLELVRMRQLEAVVWQLLDARPPHLLNARYADYDALALAAVDHAIERVTRDAPGPLSDRVLAEYSSKVMAHPLTRAVPQLGWLLNMPEVPVPGDAFVPRVTRKSGSASERFAVSPGREQSGYLHMPGGQSGHPLSPFYRAGHMAWVNGEATPFLPGATEHTLQLR